MSPKSVRSKLLLLTFSIFLLLLISFGYLLVLVNQGSAAIEAVSAQSPSEALTALAERTAMLRTGIVVSGLIITAFLLAGGFWIFRSLMRSLEAPGKLLNNLVQGDTSMSVKPTQDEFAGIIHAANQLGENLKQSSNFAQSIGEGNFDFDFKPVSEQDMLGNSLVQMREKLKNIAETDKKRNWTTEGLAMFSELIRKGGDQKKLSDTLISELVKYTKSNQGGLFILNRDNENDPYLELIACYAYDRKKYLTKRIELGTGMLGQCFLEGQPVFLTKIPKDYVTITSGLGNSNPNCLLLMPLKLNDVTEGVIELASFKKYEPHEVEFVQRIGESIASAIASTRVTEHTRRMLAESQQQSEEMRSQEEEMRQNMEEMQATQEAMERQTAEIKKMQVNLELEKSMFNVLMEFLPDRITYKDTESRIMRINKAKAQRINMTPEEVVGKTDYDFFSREHAEKAMSEEKALIDSGKPLVDIEERLVFNNGDTAWVSTSRIPFRNEHNRVTGMFIITKDITKLKIAELSLKDRESIIQRIFKTLPVLHYKVDKDRKITDAWTGEGATTIEPSSIISKNLQETFPQVYHHLEDAGFPEQQLVYEDDKLTHYIFNDSVHPGAYWIFALKK
ncbi:PAS domain-containing protein [Fulvivirgaceae bacterium PWU4]|uniref:PAS domain-containing protein n=1 Tax=Chryseosolibacter histidini TaxID=2782349 RepID=A0AAP2GQL3_9BACT|nr:PAS domain-containing protein [Chryseosolibacter histidini]MBT1700268.1 PAS domain-containing protein [Chryseosolibacter histidini]